MNAIVIEVDGLIAEMKALDKFNDDVFIQYFEKVGEMQERLSELEKTNKEINKKTLSREEVRRNNILYRDIESTFHSFFGTKVKVDAGKRSGKMVVGKEV